jgi:hypothetical protein
MHWPMKITISKYSIGYFVFISLLFSNLLGLEIKEKKSKEWSSRPF